MFSTRQCILEHSKQKAKLFLHVERHHPIQAVQVQIQINNLKVHKNENFFSSDFEICTFSKPIFALCFPQFSQHIYIKLTVIQLFIIEMF